MKKKELLIFTLAAIAPVFPLAAQQVAAGASEERKQTIPALKPTDPTLLGSQYLDPKAPIEARVEDLLAKLTIQEKAALIHGSSGFGYGNIPRIGLPEILMTDGPSGVRRQSGSATALPCGLAVAASWNPILAHRVGAVFGSECRSLSYRVFLAPGVNILRTPLGGRNFEYMGEDPYLAGKSGAAYIRGVQSQGVAACVKHWNGNEQERWRTTINLEIDDRALHEIYTPAFETAVKEGHVWTVMPAYNKFRNDFCCASKHLNKNVLFKQLGFDGALISDWGAWKNDKDSIEGGCTIEMPSAKNPQRDAKIATRIENGEISRIDFEEAVRRNLRFLIRVGAFEDWKPGRLNSTEHQRFARAAAAESIVLLKNERSILPLDASKLKSVAVIGPNAAQYHTMADGSGLQTRGGSGATRPPYEITPLAALQKRFGNKIHYASGLEFEPAKGTVIASTDFMQGINAEFLKSTNGSGEVAVSRQEKAMDFRFNTKSDTPDGINPNGFSARFSGMLKAPTKGDYELLLTSDDGSRLWIDDRLVVDNSGDHPALTKSATVALDPVRPARIRIEYANIGGKGELSLRWIAKEGGSPIEKALAIAKESDLVLFFAGTDHSYDKEALGWGDVKGADKPDLELKGPQADLIRKIAAVNPNTVVILINGAPVSVEQWHSQVPAIVESWYGGMEAGNGIVDVLCGDVNPSGKLPCTFGKGLNDWPSHQLGNLSYPGTGNNGVVKYLDSIWVGYRGFDKNGIEPRFPFGFGLSYTTFEIGHAKLSSSTIRNGENLTAKVMVKNTGKRSGSEVVQLYVTDREASVPRPPKELKGFQKIFLHPGESKAVEFTLTPRDLSFWDIQTNAWKAEPGTFEIQIGNSSRNLPKKLLLELK